MKLLIITRRKSDLTEILASVADVEVFSNEDTFIPEIDGYDGAAVLGGTEDKPIILNAYLREALERFADTGKPVFLEYTDSFRCVYSASPVTVSPHRLVADVSFGEIKEGDLLDSRCNSYIRPHFLMPDTVPLLYYREFTPAHDRIEDRKDDDVLKHAALFRDKNVLTAAFRLCNYRQAVFSPQKRWDSVINYIFGFLGIDLPARLPEPQYRIKGRLETHFYDEIDKCVSRSLKLLKEYLVTDDGARGIKEGLSHNILPDGERISADVVRTDCTGEAAGAFLFSQNGENIKKGEKMYDFCYGPLMIHGGEFDGMVRWSEQAWNVCYQDDVARAVIPSLLYAYFGLSDKYVEKAEKALDFLCKTTCADGLRPARTDMLEYIRSGEAVRTLAAQENGYASAHYNAYYSAALLLGYIITGNEDFGTVGVRGLETLMKLYPDTVREHSETSELCRLIFPLSVLYAATKEKAHYDMLDRVFNDLQKHRHISGGYAEWDTGYKAACFNNAGGECSLLSVNGDPVADLLYSLNWLPLGFAFAWHVCGEARFLNAWKDICAFFIKTQLISEDKRINGGWCRGMDLDRLEYCGIPHDVGWGPCSLETGWTVAEITTGMLIGKGLVTKKLIKKF